MTKTKKMMNKIAEWLKENEKDLMLIGAGMIAGAMLQEKRNPSDTPVIVIIEDEANKESK